jgi:hypothetical protein
MLYYVVLLAVRNLPKTIVATYLPTGLIRKLDKTRGRISRSTFILMVLERALQTNPQKEDVAPITVLQPGRESLEAHATQ